MAWPKAKKPRRESKPSMDSRHSGLHKLIWCVHDQDHHVETPLPPGKASLIEFSRRNLRRLPHLERLALKAWSKSGAFAKDLEEVAQMTSISHCAGTEAPLLAMQAFLIAILEEQSIHFKLFYAYATPASPGPGTG